MRRLIAFSIAAGVVAGAGCASMGQPPGGPPDKTPPRLVAITPDSGAVSAHPKTVVFEFDETINDRVSRGALDQYFLISPMDGAPRVSYHRSRIEVRPRRGFRANTAYTVTLLPGLGDIRGNVSKETRSVVFSTGPEIPRFGILGHVFDWAGQRPLANAIVEAIASDSTVYIVAADSSGGYDLAPIPAGRYRMFAWADQNNNRARDRTEVWDSTTVTVTTSRPIIELLAIQRDTLPPRLNTVAADDSLSLRLVFDHALDPGQPFAPSQFRVVAADSTPATIARVLTLAQADQERTDSTRRADSLAARTDTAVAHRLAADSARRQQPAPGTGRAIALAPPKPSRPAPPTTLIVRLAPATRVRPGTSYRVTASNIRSLVGIAGTSNRVFSVPRPAPADTTKRAPTDTTKRLAPRDTTKRPTPPDTTKRPPAPSPRPPGDGRAAAVAIPDSRFPTADAVGIQSSVVSRQSSVVALRSSSFEPRASSFEFRGSRFGPRSAVLDPRAVR